MQNLTIKVKGKAPNAGEIQNIGALLETKCPNSFNEFLLKYCDTRVIENRYFFEEGIYILNDILTVTEINGLIKEFIEAYRRKFIPFGIDPAGWHFCLCLDEGKDYGSVILNRWTDHLPEDQFLKIADSFEEFINGLKPRSD